MKCQCAVCAGGKALGDDPNRPGLEEGLEMAKGHSGSRGLSATRGVAARDAYLNDKSRRLVRDVAISHRCRCHVPEANADAIFMQRGKGVIFAAHHRPVPGVRSCGACASPCTRASWPN